MREFLTQAARLPEIKDNSSLQTRPQRLAFALPHLVSRDRQIADSALGEFAAAPNQAVKQLKPILNHRQLTAWIGLELAGAQQRRLIFLLLGVCGDARDLPLMKAALDDRLARDAASDLDAVIATYLILAATLGWTKSIVACSVQTTCRWQPAGRSPTLYDSTLITRR